MVEAARTVDRAGPGGTEPGRTAPAGAEPEVDPEVRRLLAAAVEGLGGSERAGQVTMADAVHQAMDAGRHLLVQAGTGTGKSLAYLVPAMVHATRSKRPVVVATATLALQSQLVGRDLPDLVASVGSRLGRPVTYAILKGRQNYACLHRIRNGVPDDQGALIEAPPSGPLGRQVVELRSWAERQTDSGESGDRDGAPTHTDRAWSEVSVSSRECLGADRCPFGGECFAERARARAHDVDVVVTNHALLAIDALEGLQVLPEHDIVVIDEAHELVARVTGSASAELTAGVAERAARRSRSFVDADLADALDEAATGLRNALGDVRPGRVEALSGELGRAVAGLRDAARSAWSAFPKERREADVEAGQRQARAQVEQVRDIADRIAQMSPHDVVWVAERERSGPVLAVAPLSVAGLLRQRLLSERTCVLTSATLKLGGDFTPLARSVGFRPVDRVGRADRVEPAAAAPTTAQDPGDRPVSGDVVDPIPWLGLDVGSPFDYPRQAILYVARRLPPPGRDGIGERALEELCALVDAAGGRTLGLFSSRRSAERAAAYVRERSERGLLCQGEGQLAELHRRFVAEPETSLFGTLSLWQGLDVPGDTCRLVVIDRIPFPRPDDPLMSARQRAVDEAGGNGFMKVAATHAALLLAQGTGRLIRRSSDRGVVAVLDPRLGTAAYGGFLRASLPPMWLARDRDQVLGALRRLGVAAAGAGRT